MERTSTAIHIFGSQNNAREPLGDVVIFVAGPGGSQDASGVGAEARDNLFKTPSCAADSVTLTGFAPFRVPEHHRRCRPIRGEDVGMSVTTFDAQVAAAHRSLWLRTYCEYSLIPHSHHHFTTRPAVRVCGANPAFWSGAFGRK
jgi:hypothetical protein